MSCKREYTSTLQTINAVYECKGNAVIADIGWCWPPHPLQ